MATFLLLIIYFAFIGLGIPDSILGSAWPSIYSEFNIPVSYASYINILISIGSVSTSVLSAKAIEKFGTGIVTAVSTVLTAVALLGFAISNSFWWFLLFSIPLGIGAGAIDSALNNYVALHYKSSHMNFLHCFYGVGVAASPLLMSLALSINNQWRDGYYWAIFIQTAIAILSIISIPLWGKVNKKTEVEEKVINSQSISFLSVAKMPSVRTIWLILIGSVGLEFTCGTWGTTFLVEGRFISTDTAALILTFYYVGMASGRFASGLISNKLGSWTVIKIGQIITFFAVIIVILPIPVEIVACGLFLIGFGNGPVFPNIAHLTPINFGADKSQMVMGTQMAASYIGVTVMPFIFGLFAQYVSVYIFGYFLMLMYMLMIVPTIIFKKKYIKK